MRMSEGRLGLLRERREEEAEVRPIELFFDLVYVLAVTQIAHYLLDHLTLRGAGETLMLLVAGIIAVAAADELTIAHPTDHATVATTEVILGGPALYLIGNALFKWALWSYVPRSRPVAILTLGALVPLALVPSVLVLHATATVVVVSLVLWDMHVERLRLRST
jgi:low temperature requirement protein LtrA